MAARSKKKPQTAVELVEALGAAWDAIRKAHPEVPSVMLLPAPANRRGVLGHFAALRWVPKKGERLHEVVVTAEHLDRDPADVFETLLHEAAHALNFARGVSDCSASQYHNGHFKRAAEELGLEVERVEHYGFAQTNLRLETKRRYGKQIQALGRALVTRVGAAAGGRGNGGTGRSGGDVDDDGADARPRSRLLKATCGCGHIIRVSRKVLDATTIRCEECAEAFDEGE